jgi:hypothetical protein
MTEKDYALYGTKILNLKTQEIGLLICIWKNKFADARIRHSSENYRIYKNNHYQAPLGGYHEKLGDPQPQETLRPGYPNSGLNSDYSIKNNSGFSY